MKMRMMKNQSKGQKKQADDEDDEKPIKKSKKQADEDEDDEKPVKKEKKQSNDEDKEDEMEKFEKFGNEGLLKGMITDFVVTVQGDTYVLIGKFVQGESNLVEISEKELADYRSKCGEIGYNYDGDLSIEDHRPNVKVAPNVPEL
jgi:hypothetical protein